MTTETDQRETFSAKLVELSDDKVVLAVPGTEYQLHLTPGVPTAQFNAAVGKRITGMIEANALRIHPASGGGQFIEPVWGHPRIVSGVVRAVNAEAGRVLVDAVVPMWVTAPAQQDFSVIQPGHMVNFYIESGARFLPIDDD